ncbi:MAG: metallophosphoesterase [Candidatus Micrarchaeia archaeon]|jgi:DNA repair exonuclease SbcCD nuclease subunit
MKLAILSDLHFGYRRFYDDAFSQASEAMKLACERADIVLVPGDLFDSRSPTPHAINMALKVFSIPQGKKWAAKVEGAEGAVPVFFVRGDHERPASQQHGKDEKMTFNLVSILETARLAIDAHHKPYVVEMDGEKVAVQGLANVPHELARQAIEVRNYKPMPNAFNIFMFHQSIRELLPDEEAMGLEDLPAGFDLYVCGHMHSNSVRTVGKAKLLIPGSTVLTQMKKDEEGGKGIYIYDTKARKEEFVPIKSRPFFYRELKLHHAALADVQKEVEKMVKELAVSGKEKPIIKIKITGTLAKGLSAENVALELGALEKLAFVEVSKELEGMGSEKAALIRDIREQKVSVKDMGMAMLKKKLEERGAKVKDVEALFELLAEAKDGEEAFEKMKE